MHMSIIATPIKISWFSFFLFIALFSQPVLSDVISVQGRVIDDASRPIKGVVIEVQDIGLASTSTKVSTRNVTTDADGRFTIMLPEPLFQLVLDSQGFYSSIHSFSLSELLQNGGTIPAIKLTERRLGRVMLAFGGDVMMGRRFFKPYFDDPELLHDESLLDDSRQVVEQMKPYMSLADLAAVNLETQIASETPKKKAKKSVVFFSQPALLSALTWAGIDYVTLGNNHTYDYLESGLDSTLKHLSQSQLGYSGAGKTSNDALKAHWETINGQPFSMLGYVGWEGGAKVGQAATADHGGAAYGSLENIVSTVIRETKGSRHTVVQYHGSLEYKNEPTGVTEQRLKSAIDVGASLAIAHHPHVAQGLELYQNRLIAYSMGNFIFDQNFNSTQLSFILYVWLDEGEFHRAEIVPIYLKGYKPTPAVGLQRHYVMKRLSELSEKRNTYISTSGGHGVIESENKETLKAQYSKTVQPSGKNVLFSLAASHWGDRLTSVEMKDEQLQYRLGVNLINGSDFEHYADFNTSDRTWLIDAKSNRLNLGESKEGKKLSGNTSLELTLDNSAWLGMKHFRRVYNSSSPMTAHTQVNTATPVTLNFYWQGRKTRQKLFDAFKNSEKQLIKSVKVSGKEGWQSIAADFNSPRIGYKSYRVLVEIVSTTQDSQAQSQIIAFDDFSLIEWQSAYSSNSEPNGFHFGETQASVIGFNQAASQPVVLQFN
ncbi:CapA family protein [Shewanella sp. D64]|uniref:CapA family protein n=1 Tax=unclassified Shewanella TaxID=196818 RepID=UPI0022BA34AF|nr:MULTISPECIES: CapA family protein [unclassified Shewanella]MEC4727068.1 CapA family protein [Shewanella sp. D64]MEC4737807.1 CapA family protein [Shewanella sp. E94]WBJ93936.1 CapA family protein [Shewanella sp. MTB7]